MIVVTKGSDRLIILKKKTIMMTNNEIDQSHQTIMQILQLDRSNINPDSASPAKAPMLAPTSDKLILPEIHLQVLKKELHSDHLCKTADNLEAVKLHQE